MLTWNLDTITSDFKKLYAKANKEIEAYKRLKLENTMSARSFQDIIDLDTQTQASLTRLGSYAHLRMALDLKDQDAIRMQSKLHNLELSQDEARRPLSFWLKGLGRRGLDEKNAKRLFSTRKELAHHFKRLRDVAKHTLSPKEERVTSRKDQLGDTLLDLYDQIVQGFEYQVQGKKLKHQSELHEYIYSPKAAVREEAYRSLLRPYEKMRTSFFLIYQSICKDYSLEAKARGFKTPLSAKNFSNDVSDKAVRVLLDTCAKNKTLYHDYFKLKAKLLKTKKLRRFDIYAPLKTSTRKVSFEEAKTTVLEAFESFDPRLAEHAKTIFKGHLDSHPRANKQTGAFCASVLPDIPPYVMTNFTGTLRDISTLAHELGHAAHHLFSSHLPLQTFHATLPLAETASTFCELLVFDALLAKANKKEKISLLAEKLGDSFATILRQCYFVKFEIKAHEMLSQGTNEDELCKAYQANLQEQFGTSIDIDEIFKNEWAYIPHIYHSPFYCYSYSFGELLSLALYARYLKDRSFKKEIITILSKGGSQSPAQIVKPAGIDLEDPNFWQGGFTIVKNWTRELKALTQAE